jgi:hypothetical protein
MTLGFSIMEACVRNLPRPHPILLVVITGYLIWFYFVDGETPLTRLPIVIGAGYAGAAVISFIPLGFHTLADVVRSGEYRKPWFLFLTGVLLLGPLWALVMYFYFSSRGEI